MSRAVFCLFMMVAMTMSIVARADATRHHVIYFQGIEQGELVDRSMRCLVQSSEDNEKTVSDMKLENGTLVFGRLGMRGNDESIELHVKSELHIYVYDGMVRINHVKIDATVGNRPHERSARVGFESEKSHENTIADMIGRKNEEIGACIQGESIHSFGFSEPRVINVYMVERR